MPSSRGSSQPKDQTQVSHIVGIVSLPTKPPGKPKKTGVDSLSLLQGIFLSQESNHGLLHCRQFLYQLSYHGSPVNPLKGSQDPIPRLHNCFLASPPLSLHLLAGKQQYSLRVGSWFLLQGCTYQSLYAL